jgi:tetratricopeptide (TPR) repeat protein
VSQEFNKTVVELASGDGIAGGETFVPRLSETLRTFAGETLDALQVPKWRCQFHGRLNAGYILAILGHSAKAVEVLDQSIQIHHDNREKYDAEESTILQFVVTVLSEVGAAPQIVDPYRHELTAALQKEAQSPEDIQRAIAHIEADLECATGSLDEIYPALRRNQGLLYQRLGNHEKAIELFQKALQDFPRDFLMETTVKNSLSIVDSHLEIGAKELAKDIFIGLVKRLGLENIQLGSKLPESFTDWFTVLHPYFAKLDLTDSLQLVAECAAARLPHLATKKDRYERELRTLTEILALYFVDQGEYQKASDIVDAARAQLEYGHNLSRRKQAKMALYAGNLEKVRTLIADDDKDRDEIGFSGEVKTFELANLELLLGDLARALDRLDNYCAHQKRQSYPNNCDSIFEARRSQIDIMKGAIGKAYLQKVRDHVKQGPPISLPDAIQSLDYHGGSRTEPHEDASEPVDESWD